MSVRVVKPVPYRLLTVMPQQLRLHYGNAAPDPFLGVHLVAASVQCHAELRERAHLLSDIVPFPEFPASENFAGSAAFLRSSNITNTEDINHWDAMRKAYHLGGALPHICHADVVRFFVGRLVERLRTAAAQTNVFLYAKFEIHRDLYVAGIDTKAYFLTTMTPDETRAVAAACVAFMAFSGVYLVSHAATARKITLWFSWTKM